MLIHTQIDERAIENTLRGERIEGIMSIWRALGVGDGSPYQGGVFISAGRLLFVGLGGASLWSMSKSSVIFAGFERKASIPAFKHSCFVDSWQSALKAMT